MHDGAWWVHDGVRVWWVHDGVRGSVLHYVHVPLLGVSNWMMHSQGTNGPVATNTKLGEVLFAPSNNKDVVCMNVSVTHVLHCSEEPCALEEDQLELVRIGSSMKR